MSDKKPGAAQQQTQLVFGLQYRPGRSAAGQVRRFLAQKADEIEKRGIPNSEHRPRTPYAGDNQAKG